MKAIICTAYGPPEVLELREVEKPTPQDRDVLIRVHATTVTRADVELRRFTFPLWIWLPIRIAFGIRKPRIRILGQEFAGQVEAVGKEVSSFAPGDRVFGKTSISLGAHAEYVRVRQGGDGGELAKMPAEMTYQEAAPIAYGGSEALRFLRKGGVQGGCRVLVVGAGGSFGTFAVQLAKMLGAEVTAVDSTGKLEMLRSIGADRVVDYTQEDFTASGETHDVIFDVVCRARFSRLVRLLRPKGRLLLANPQTSHLLQGLWTSMTSDKKVTFGVTSRSEDDLPYLAGLVATGKLRPVIDRTFALAQMVEAHRYAETEEKRGNIVVTVTSEQ